MSEIEPDRHQEVARELRERGPAAAPPDLAGEVMRRVRAEPRHSTRSFARPLVTLLAAAVVALALIAGVAKLGGGTGSSASGGSTASGPEGVNAPAVGDAGSRVFGPVSLSALRHLATVYGAAFDCPAAADALPRYALAVPYDSWDAVRAQLDDARKLLSHDSPRVTVQLKRLAQGAAATGVEVTCP